MRRLVGLLASGLALSAAAAPALAAITCDIGMSAPVYQAGDQVTVSKLRVTNTDAGPVGVQVQTWKEQPVGANAVFQEYEGKLQAGMDQDFGPKTLFTVGAGTTAGTYRFGCRILDPVTGALLSEEVNRYTVGTTLAVSGPYLQYRSFETAASNTFRGWLDLRRSGAPITAADIRSVVVKGPTGSVIPSTTYSLYDSTYQMYTASGSRTLGDPMLQTGISVLFPTSTTLAAGTYVIEVTDNTDGKVFKQGIDFPGKVSLTPVAASSIDYAWEGGALHLWWTAPTDAHDDVFAAFGDAAGDDFLYVRGLKGRSDFVIPDYVVSAAKALAPGLTSWTLKMQTRKTSAGSMNYARSLSNPVTVNLP